MGTLKTFGVVHAADEGANAPLLASVTPTGAPGPYSPIPVPPAHPVGQLVIMPFGDSITSGTGSTDLAGYRSQMFHITNGTGRNITFVGSLSTGPATVDGVPFPAAHEGHGGFTIDSVDGSNGILPIAAARIATYAPNVITLMIGTNDINAQVRPNEINGRMLALLDVIHTASPSCWLTISTIIPALNQNQSAQVLAFNAYIRTLVKSLSASWKIGLVDAYAAFVQTPNYQNALMSDSLHPNDAGYVVLGNAFFGGLP